MSGRRLLALGAIVFLFAALFRTPAERLLAWASTSLADANLELQGVDGTLSAGRVAQLQLRNQTLARDLDWTLQKLQLLIGRASFRLSGGREGTLIDGTAFLLPSGTLGLRDFKAAMPAQDALALAGYGLLPVEGQAALALDAVDLRKGWPHRAQGTLSLRGLGSKLGRETVNLGDFEAVIENETAGIKATLRSLGGPLDASGEARLGQDRSYELHVQFKPRPDAPPLVANLVRSLGQPDAQGWHHLRERGAAPAPAETHEPLETDVMDAPDANS